MEAKENIQEHQAKLHHLKELRLLKSEERVIQVSADLHLKKATNDLERM